eukprot:4498074-Amphidinium_carterae.1
MDDANGEPPSQEETPGAELGGDALAVEEARKRVHAALDAGGSPLDFQQETEGHQIIERLHLRPAAKASREYPEEKFGLTGTPQGAHSTLPGGTGQETWRLPGSTGTEPVFRPWNWPGKKLSPAEYKQVPQLDRTLAPALRLAADPSFAWPESTLCAPHIQSRRSQGDRHRCDQNETCQGYRQIGWLPITYRIGEAHKPGPTICSVNPGGWSLVEP